MGPQLQSSRPSNYKNLPAFFIGVPRVLRGSRRPEARAHTASEYAIIGLRGLAVKQEPTCRLDTVFIALSTHAQFLQTRDKRSPLTAPETFDHSSLHLLPLLARLLEKAVALAGDHC